MLPLKNGWENKISVKVALKLSQKKLKNTLLPLNMNFKNLLVLFIILFCFAIYFFNYF